jgi:hypothetical protein
LVQARVDGADARRADAWRADIAGHTGLVDAGVPDTHTRRADPNTRCHTDARLANPDTGIDCHGRAGEAGDCDGGDRDSSRPIRASMFHIEFSCMTS